MIEHGRTIDMNRDVCWIAGFKNDSHWYSPLELARWMSTSERDDEQRKYVPGTLGEKVVLAINVNHAVLENALPLVTDTRHLSTTSAPTKSHKVSTDLIIGAKDEVLRHSTLVVITIVLVRVVQIAIDSLRVRDGRSGSRLR
jgi:hypothetical protein